MTPVTPDASHSMQGDERDRGGLANLRRPFPDGTTPAATQAPPGGRPPLAIVRLCLLPELGRVAVETAERFADGQATRDEMRRAADAAYLLGEGTETDGTGVDSASALIAASAAAGEVPHAGWPAEPLLGTARTAAWHREWAARCPLLRDVFGNP